MQHVPRLSLQELKEALTTRYLLNLAVIHLALASGVFIFGAIAVFLFLEPASSGGPRGMDTVHMLSLVHLGVACSAAAIAPVLFGVLIDRSAKAARNASAAVRGVQTAYIVRLALLEGPAMLGLVICFLMDRSLLNESPVYGLNLGTPVLFLLFVAVTFPTKNRLEDLLRDRFSQIR